MAASFKLNNADFPPLPFPIFLSLVSLFLCHYRLLLHVIFSSDNVTLSFEHLSDSAN